MNRDRQAHEKLREKAEEILRMKFRYVDHMPWLQKWVNDENNAGIGVMG